MQLKKFFMAQELSPDKLYLFEQEQAYINFYRTRFFVRFLSAACIGLFFLDYTTWKEGLWSTIPGYRHLLYMHIILLISMLLFLIAGYTLKRSISQPTHLYKIYSYSFSLYVLYFTAVLSGAIEQNIHGYITEYIIGCLSIAVINYVKPKISLLFYSSSYIVFTIALLYFQPDWALAISNFTNVSVLIFIAWFLSLVHYQMRVREFLAHNFLEQIVSERTLQLEQANQKLLAEIADRKQIEDKIYRLATIVESTDDGVVAITMEGIISDWNAGAERIYGYAAHEIVGKSVFLLVPAELHPELEQLLTKVRDGGSVRHFETLRKGKNGETLDVSLTVSPLMKRDGSVIGASTIIRDITEQKQMEREMLRLGQLNLIGEMAAGISHEVRNPMTTVKGFLQLMSEKDGFSEHRGHFRLMIDELDRANAIITEFLSIGKTKVAQLMTHNLSTIVQALYPLLEADAIRSEKNVKLELEVVSDLSLNDKEIRQVILNLARNGLEAMNAGGQLTLKTYDTESEVILAVKDQGKGIDPDLLEKLGTPFLTTKENGTGLGLAVCYGIAARNNAVISVETNPNGTTFFVRFRKL